MGIASSTSIARPADQDRRRSPPRDSPSTRKLASSRLAGREGDARVVVDDAEDHAGRHHDRDDRPDVHRSRHSCRAAAACRPRRSDTSMTCGDRRSAPPRPRELRGIDPQAGPTRSRAESPSSARPARPARRRCSPTASSTKSATTGRTTAGDRLPAPRRRPVAFAKARISPSVFVTQHAVRGNGDLVPTARRPARRSVASAGRPISTRSRQRFSWRTRIGMARMPSAVMHPRHPRRAADRPRRHGTAEGDRQVLTLLAAKHSLEVVVRASPMPKWPRMISATAPRDAQRRQRACAAGVARSLAAPSCRSSPRARRGRAARPALRR